MALLGRVSGPTKSAGKSQKKRSGKRIEKKNKRGRVSVPEGHLETNRRRG